MTISDTIADCISRLESSSADFEFPAGGDVSIPLETELALLNAITEESPLTTERIMQIRQKSSPNDCYGCVIFAVRMAILAVRQNDANVFRFGLHGLLFDNGQVDYRDLLGALSITENCALRIGLRYETEVKPICQMAEDRVRSTIEAYLARSPEMRDVEVLGFVAEEREQGLFFLSRN